MAGNRTRFHLVVAALHLLLLGAMSEPDPESAILIEFQSSLKNASQLENWDPRRKVCNGSSSSWEGIRCVDDHVTVLQLEGIGLYGFLDLAALSRLTSLRSLSVMNNSFVGAFPDVKKLRGLRALYLSFNRFSGEIQDDAFSGLTSLRRVVIANNAFWGKIPASLTELPRLVDLQLQNNQFSGEIPKFSQKDLVVNLANNKLQGPVQPSWQNTQRSDSLEGNRLCGLPTNPCPKKKSLPKTVIISLAVAGGVIVLVTAFLAAWLLCGRSDPTKTAARKSQTKVGDEQSEELRKKTDEEESRGGLHFVNNVSFKERKKFEVEDLFGASAEVLGSGSFGSSYKADVDSGLSLVVKRFRHMGNLGKEQFFEHMRRLGKLSHPNVLPLLAFYYTKEEKLLVTDFAQLGSLASHLHGRRSTNKPGLDWPTRLYIVQGVAKGLAHLHKELPTLNLPHGNLKSSNVLLNKDLEPLLADYALSPVINRGHAQQFMVAYKSPEFMHHGQVTRKTDVWSLGILILELLTGRFPANYLRQGMVANADLVSWVNSVVREEWTGEVFDKEMGGSTRSAEGEMLKLLKIGMCCCKTSAEERWDLKVAVEKIERLKARDDGDDDNYAGEEEEEEEEEEEDSSYVDEEGMSAELLMLVNSHL